MSEGSSIGIVGLGTMGSNLALNASDAGHSVALLDLDDERVRTFATEHADRDLVATSDADTFVAALASPRRVLLSVPAGDPVDAVLRDLAPRLSEGDIVVDGGNSQYRKTERRSEDLAERGIRFVGMGISGGAEGARHGPSLMPGGPREAYDELEPVLEAIAAEGEFGPCVAYLGPGGAGHFVKMVHNGIEYADMQAIAEAYDVLKRVAGYGAERLAATFSRWNEGPLESFLIEITAGIFGVDDPDTGEPLVERILDEASQKGTGRWTAVEALQLGVPAPTITAAVDARVISSRREDRLAGQERLAGPADSADPSVTLEDDLHDALLANRIASLAQGIDLIRHASEANGWNVPLAEAARVWTAGCIIRSRLLGPVHEALSRNPAIANLLLDEDLAERIEGAGTGWRRAVAAATIHGIPVPCLGASLAYFDAFRTGRLPQNLTQAQRDWFGSHTYHRLDDPDDEAVHTDWAERSGRVVR